MELNKYICNDVINNILYPYLLPKKEYDNVMNELKDVDKCYLCDKYKEGCHRCELGHDVMLSPYYVCFECYENNNRYIRAHLIKKHKLLYEMRK